MSPELCEAENRPAAPLPSELPPRAIPPNPRSQAILEDLLAQASSIGQRLAELQAELAAGKQAAGEEAKEDEEAKEGEKQNDRASAMPVTSLEPTAHVARRLRVSVRTVERWIKAGILDPPMQVNGRNYHRVGVMPKTDDQRSKTRPSTRRKP
jgi:hypothetical protein